MYKISRTPLFRFSNQMAYQKSSPPWLKPILMDPKSIEAVSGGLSPKEVLGCGHYGCVVATEDPNKVIKITRDPTEAPIVELIKDLQEKDDLPGFVRFYSIGRLTEVKVWGRIWPIHVIVREAVTPWWQLRPSYVEQRLTRTALESYLDEASKWWFIPDSDERGRDELRQKIRTTLQDMKQVPALQFIARGLGQLLAEGHPPLSDIHSGNIGWLENGNLAIFDPGHTPLMRPAIPDIASLLPELLYEVVDDLDTEVWTELEIEYQRESRIERGTEGNDLPPFDEWVRDQAWEFRVLELIDDAAGASFPLLPAFGLSAFPTNEIELDWMEAIIKWLDLIGPDYLDVFGGHDLNQLPALYSVIGIGQDLLDSQPDDLPAPKPRHLRRISNLEDLYLLRLYLRELRRLYAEEILGKAVDIFTDNHPKSAPLTSLVDQAYGAWLYLIEERWRAEYAEYLPIL